MEAALQSPSTSQRFSISATRTGGHQTEIRSHILTLDVHTYVGAGQILRTDKETKHKWVLLILEAAKRVGVSTILLATEDEKDA